MHGGNIYQFATQLHCEPSTIIDFSSNIHFKQALDWQQLPLDLAPYADPDYFDLKQAIKCRYALPPNIQLELFNGASAAIFSLLRFLKPHHVTFYAPLYSEYLTVTKELDCSVHMINRFNEDLFCSIPFNSTVIFVNPATPDGKCYSLDKLFHYWKSLDCTIIIDESFLDFCDVPSIMTFINDYEKLFVVKSLCKFYGCAGIRVGFIAGSHTISVLRHTEPMWKISTFDSLYMQQALKNSSFIYQTKNETIQLRKKLHYILEKSALFENFYTGSANFILATLRDKNGYQLQDSLIPFNILIRVCENFNFLNKQVVRFAVKSEANIEKLALALTSIDG